MPTPEDVPRRAETTPSVGELGVDLGLEPSSGRGRRHGTSNTEPFDRWFRYPAGFASDYVATLLQHLDLGSGGTIVDPFAGSAVTGTAAHRSGFSFYGIEAHPLIAELGRLKLQAPPAEGGDLVDHGESLIGEVTNYLDTGRSYDLSRETDLVRRCFTDETLTQLVVLREAIQSGRGGDWGKYLKWALLSTLRDVASARVGWPYQRPGSERKPQYRNVLARFRQRVAWMAVDIDSALTPADSNNDDLAGIVVQGDSRHPDSWAGVAPGSVQGCVSSPPYLNNFDYADATRLELYFWGEVTSWAEMCSQVRIDMITATTQQSSVGGAKASLAQLQSFNSTAVAIEDLVTRLSEERAYRARGKEYDQVIPAYFIAISQVLNNLASALAPGAPAILLVGDSAPYGVYVDTPALIAELSQHVGFSAEKDIILRRRGLRWGTNSQRHSTELTERLVLLRRQ